MIPAPPPPRPLTGSIGGRPIPVAASSSPGTLVHEARQSRQCVTLYAMNNGAAPVVLTVEWGGTVAPDDHLIVTLPPAVGPVEIAPGLPIGKGLAIGAFASEADVVTVVGHVSRALA